MRWLPLLLVLVGCAKLPPLSFRPDAGVKLLPAGCAFDAQLAQDILARRHIVEADDFEGAFQLESIEVRIEWDSFPCSAGGCQGEDWPLGGVVITRDGKALLHELLHVWEHEHFVFSTDHPGWAANGWFDADNEFAGQAQPVGEELPQ